MSWYLKIELLLVGVYTTAQCDWTASTGSKGLIGCPTGGRRSSGPWMYYLDQALFHMSTHLLLAPSQWGTAQRTYLPPLLRLPPLHLPYTSWKHGRHSKRQTDTFLMSNCPRTTVNREKNSEWYFCHMTEGNLAISIPLPLSTAMPILSLFRFPLLLSPHPHLRPHTFN